MNRNGQIFGPYSAEQVGQMLSSGDLLPIDLAGIKGQTQWKPLSSFPQFAKGKAVPVARPVAKPKEMAESGTLLGNIVLVVIAAGLIYAQTTGKLTGVEHRILREFSSDSKSSATAEREVVSPEATQKSDPVAELKRIAASLSGCQFQIPASDWQAWRKTTYSNFSDDVIEEHARTVRSFSGDSYDVEKTDSLTSPFTATLFVSEHDKDGDKEWVEGQYRVKLAWQDGHWVAKRAEVQDANDGSWSAMYAVAPVTKLLRKVFGGALVPWEISEN